MESPNDNLFYSKKQLAVVQFELTPATRKGLFNAKCVKIEPLSTQDPSFKSQGVVGENMYQCRIGQKFTLRKHKSLVHFYMGLPTYFDANYPGRNGYEGFMSYELYQIFRKKWIGFH